MPESKPTPRTIETRIVDAPPASRFTKFWSLCVVDPLIILATIAYGTVSLASSIGDVEHRRQTRVARRWARTLLRIAGARLTLEGLENIHPDGSYVFASNHLSFMDTPVVLSCIPVHFRFLAKAGLFNIPFLGWYLRRAGHIAVPRDDPRAALKTLSKAAETLRKLSISLLVFPEGGRSPDGILLDFKDGAAYLAIKGQVPLVPIAIVGTHELLPMGSGTFRRGIVRLVISEPIPTEGLSMSARQAITQQAKDRIAAILGQA